eukprot:Rhum_TRINITY_DN14797_c4_g3::Rhum_TRINITY_DN14797_c4_g3_i1::g.117082::m.117082
MSSDYAGYLQARTGFDGAAARVTGDSGSDVVFALCPASENSPAAGAEAAAEAVPPPFLLCYSDLRCEYYDVELGYEQLREARDADPGLKAKGWGDVFGWLAASLRANTVDASWVGAADGGASAGAEVMTLAFRGSGLVFDLRSYPAPPEAAASRIARLALHLAAQASSSAAALAEAQTREQHLNALLQEEKQKNATLRQAVATAAVAAAGAAAAGVGGGGAPDFLYDTRGGGSGAAQDAQGSGAGHASQGHKRKIHSLVNPAAKVRRPRGTRLGGS